MFILIPTIIIFLCISYLQINDDVGVTTQVILYILMLLTTLISLFLYKKVKNDMNLQDVNSILIEIERLNQKIDKTTDEKIILGLKHKIELLEKEKETKYH
ncbi:MAG: hypothetical protein DRG78_05195 [Epsilonproteobacteria bacterium]|nr:MAG: hypothetical protein DRG78_05195 [Campylobacterota bacterium]